jgi:uncharacterized protein
MVESIRIPAGEDEWLDSLFQTLEDSDLEISDRILVIMIHDYPGGHKSSNNDLYGDLEHFLEQDKFDTLRFDFRGCGESDGQSENFTFQTARQDLQAILLWARKAGYKSCVFMAEGFGNCIAMMEQHEDLRAFIMLWPMLDPKGSWLKSYMEKVPDESSEEGFVVVGEDRVGKLFLRQLHECDMAKYIAKIDVPVLIQHGSRDENTPIEQLNILRSHIQSSRRVDITSYESGGHGLRQLNERETMFRHIRHFLKHYFARK